MNKETAVRVESLSKTYKLYRRPLDRVLDAFHPSSQRYHQPFYALRDISFDVPKGDTLGIIGRNGSGKSTLLQVICGILRPSSGAVEVNGRISALLELGAGFNPEFTGRENVYLSGAIMGLSKEEIDDRYEAITAFAAIGEFIDQPVKTYSTGMFVRLAFALAAAVDPDILVVDEALAVGDIYFQHKCIERMRDLLRKGTTLLFVTHDITAVKSLCRRALWIEKGEVAALGGAEEVVNAYFHQVVLENGEPSAPPAAACIAAEEPCGASCFRRNEAFFERTKTSRSGSGEAAIVNAEILDASGRSQLDVAFGLPVTVRIHVQFYTALSDVNVGFLVRDLNGVEILGTNLCIEGRRIERVTAGETAVVDFSFVNVLQEGSYSVACAVGMSDERGFRILTTFDWIDNAAVFRSTPELSRIVHGKVFLPVSVEIRR